MIRVGQYYSVRLISCLAMLMSVSLLAAPAAEHPFGVALATPSPLVVPSQSIDPRQALAASEDATQRISSLKEENGPYNAALAPLLTQEASRALELGDTASALTLYQQALYNVRVNGGLYGEAQLPILQSIMGLLRLSGDVTALDNRVDYFYRLMGSGQPPWNTPKIQGALYYLAWGQEKLSHQPWAGKEREIIELVETGERLIDSVCKNPDFAADWCGKATLRHLASLYLIQWRVTPTTQITPSNRYKEMPDWRNTGDAERSPILDRLQMMRRSLKTKGTAYLKDALLVANETQTLKLALADWYWFFGDVTQAKTAYADLYEEEPRLFKMPTPLPIAPTLTRDPGLAKDSAPVNFSAQVSAKGTPQNVTASYVGETIEEGKGWESRGVRYFRTLRFRPAMDDNGEFIAAPVELLLTVMR